MAINILNSSSNLAITKLTVLPLKKNVYTDCNFFLKPIRKKKDL